MGLRYFAPSPSLRNVVSSYYAFHVDLPRFSDRVGADFAQLRFMITGTAEYRMGAQELVKAPRIALLGPTFQASNFIVYGPALVVGAGLLPAGWATLVGENADKYVNKVCDAPAIFGATLEDAIERMAPDSAIEASIEVLDQLMRTLFARVQDPPLWFTRLTEQWLTASASPQVDDLIHAVGMSARQVERLTKRIYGAPPKTLARKYRALRAASEMLNQQRDWHEVVDMGFSDQSHFIREFRQFIGMTPHQFLKNPSPVLRLRFERRRLVDKLSKLTKMS